MGGREDVGAAESWAPGGIFVRRGSRRSLVPNTPECTSPERGSKTSLSYGEPADLCRQQCDGHLEGLGSAPEK